MLKKPLHNARNRRSSGFTLMEVVVGLALAATLLVAVLTACGHHLKQLRLADTKMAAIKVADQMLAEWYHQDGRIPVNAGGSCGQASNLIWQTESRTIALGTSSSKKPLEVEVVRLSIFRKEDGSNATLLISIEVMQSAST